MHILQSSGGRPPETPQPQPPGWQPVQNAHVRKALLLMEQNLSSPLPVGKIAQTLGVSERQMERIFRDILGVSPRRASLLVRLRFAMWLVTTSTYSLTVISQEAGFGDLAHFSNSFFKEYGVRPSTLRSRASRMVHQLQPPHFLEPASGLSRRRAYDT
jgi:transcriptional regulator GlxA family with amidase domain